MKETILESISDGVFTVDLNWRITYFNRAAELITGIPREEALGAVCADVFRCNMCEEGCALRTTLETSKPLINKHAYIVTFSGEKKPISVSTAILQDDQGNVIGGAETFRDLSELESLRKKVQNKYNASHIIGSSKKIKDLIQLASIVARSSSTVLIEGDTGTGKEVFARYIHQASQRSAEPFMALNCAALPETLLESELFGHKKGAFTGADTDKPGRFKVAGKGTIFLDEIGEISNSLQVKLLRVLQERTFEPLGSTKTLKCNARIIAATNRNLQEMVAKGKFRKDFYYRINVIKLDVPPLKERMEDLPLLADNFVKAFNKSHNRYVPGLSQEVIHIFMRYNWPGNVRELENVIERAFILCGESEISAKHLPEYLLLNQNAPEAEGFSLAVKENEKNIIEKALAEANYNRQEAARRLKIHKATLYRKIRKLAIHLPASDGRSQKKLSQ